MHRFFVPPEWLENPLVVITGPQAHQISQILRLQKGEDIILLDGSGWEHRLEIQKVSRQRVEGKIVQRTISKSEPRTKITLYQALLKGKGLDTVLQKGTEVGMVAFVPVVSSRCVVSSLEDIGEAKYQRWRRIIQEAAEQSHRGLLPALRPAIMLGQAWEQASRGGLTLVPWEEAEKPSLHKVLDSRKNPFSISLFIGPEGGFTPQEIAQGEKYGALPLTLGPRILRAETAGLVAASAILYHLGDIP
ncbi:MAG: 16S rRNA (uracil(1498)-N(3))-methyltransferase [Chloroflexi bacterium]|nr:16S rRNA (uracil(1498)-N(3))-methyltransferase [Chloroflexota bacterium]